MSWKKSYPILIFIFGIAVGIVVANFLSLATPNAYANATAGNTGNLIAVTGLCSNSYSGLWVVDSTDSDKSPSVCLYVPVSGGRGFKLAAARRIKWDLKLLEYNDKSKRKMRASYLSQRWKEMNKKAEKKAK